MHRIQNLHRSQQLLLLSTWLERSTPRICFSNALRLARNIRSAGADPGFFLGGGALVSCSTSTPINHIVCFFFFLQNTSCIREPQVISGGGGVRTPCTLPLDPPLAVWTFRAMQKLQSNFQRKSVLRIFSLMIAQCVKLRVSIH